MLAKVDKKLLITLLVTISLIVLTSTLSAAAGDIERVSTDSNGNQGFGDSINPSISADGRYVAYLSKASTLVEGDNNGAQDVFVHDRNTGITSRVSVDSNGNGANADSFYPSISDDGRYVVFASSANNLITSDDNGFFDVFVHDRDNGTTKRVSVSSSGDEGNNHSSRPSISGDGQYIVFDSGATNLVADDLNGAYDVFVHELGTGVTTRVSIDGQNESDGASAQPTISANGRYIAFRSSATNLTSSDPNGDFIDIFVADRSSKSITRVNFSDSDVGGRVSYVVDPVISGDGSRIAFWASYIEDGEINGRHDVFVAGRGGSTAIRVSESSAGIAGNAWSRYPDISGDGRYVVFTSWADNLVENDNNGQIDIFIHDIESGSTERLITNPDGTLLNGSSEAADINGDGSFVAFHSEAFNLVTDDTNGAKDVFVTQRGSVTNSPPSITDLSPSSTDPISLNDQPVNLTVSFADPDSGDSHEIDVDWGDGSVENLMDVTSPVALSHTYTAAGIYAVKVTVTDSAGNSDSARYEYFVIYDPDGGFVTGHGKILSEPAWCHDSSLCGSIGGNAHFGFVSRYQRGAMTPSGRTTFVFRAGSFDFQSIAYRWLVVNRGGSSAQFRGEGLVNDALAKSGAYQFMIWAGDGTGTDGEDTFRIKIWYEEDGQEKVVYDNESGQPVANGKIKVQAN